MYPKSWLGRWLTLSALSALLGAVFLGPLNVVERLFLDARFVVVSQLSDRSASSEHVTIVLLDERSEARIGIPVGSDWREFFPEIIDILVDAGAKVIVFDMEFLAEEPEWDQALSDRIEAAGNVIAGEWERGTTVARLSDSFDGIGSLRVKAVNGVPRSIAFGAEQEPLSLLAAAHFASDPGNLPSTGGHFWISFFQPTAYFPTFSFVDLLDADGERMANPRATPLSVFRDKAVLIGTDLPGVDRYVFPHTLGETIPGVYGHAYAVETLLSNRPLSAVPVAVNAALLVAFTLVFCLLQGSRHKYVRRVVMPLWPALMFAVSVVGFARFHLWIAFAPLFVSSIAAVLLQWTANRWLLREGLRSAFGFDPDLVVAFRRRAADGIVQETAAVLCADIRNFTPFVLNGDPVAVSAAMNEYLQEMETAITGNGGYVNKYVGDEIVAVFGFPLDGQQTAYRAVLSGIAMLAGLSRLVANWKERGVEHFRHIGIGIDFGSVTFAEVGGRSRRQFDIIGNAINGAARIQALTKEIGYAFAVSDGVMRELGAGQGDGQGAGEFTDLFTSMGAHTLRGQGERLLHAYSSSRRIEG